MSRPSTLGVLALALIAPGCGGAFWDRSPRVAGTACAPAPSCAPPAYAPAPSCAPPAYTPAPCAPPAYAPPPAPYASAPAPRYGVAPTPCLPAPDRWAEPPAPVAVGSAPGTPSEEEETVLREVNRLRAARGLRPFDFHPVLHAVAHHHSQDQHRRGYMGHVSPDPSCRTLRQRMTNGGYDGRTYAEVVAKGYRDVPSVIDGWMNSRSHREILLDPGLTQAGFARVSDLWTGNFGTPMPARPTWTRPAPVPAPRHAPAPAPRYAPAPAPRVPTSALPAPAVRAPERTYASPAPAYAPAPTYAPPPPPVAAPPPMIFAPPPVVPARPPPRDG